MKKWIKMGILGVLVIGIVFMSGCTTSPADKRMTGKYFDAKYPERYIELNGDGTYYQLQALGSGSQGTYKIVNNTIRLCEASGNCAEYTIEGNALVRKGIGSYVSGPVTTVTTPTTTQTTIAASGQKLYFQVKKNPVTSKISVIFAGSAGEGSIKSADIKVTHPDGSVATGIILPPKGVTAITLEGSQETDRVEIIARMSDGTTYRVYDELVP
jgi:hypothetical protein